jgi:hypothetical protein
MPHHPLWAVVPVAASRELARSALPDVPVVADERRRGSGRRRRGSWRLRRRVTLALSQFAEPATRRDLTAGNPTAKEQP